MYNIKNISERKREREREWFEYQRIKPRALMKALTKFENKNDPPENS